ncbi:hypothetical protein V8E36_007240 [Tilletia maclaganii]
MGRTAIARAVLTLPLRASPTPIARGEPAPIRCAAASTLASSAASEWSERTDAAPHDRDQARQALGRRALGLVRGRREARAAACASSRPFSTSARRFEEGSQRQTAYEYALANPPAGPTGETVPLEYDLHQPRATDGAVADSRTGAIVVAHGLFGSKQNWRSLGKSIASRTGLPVYALDLRNHGGSPHVDSLHYADMAQDIIRFLKDKVQPEIGSKGVVLIGHSMGGKAAQAVALSPDLPQDMLTGLISVDMSPKRGALSKEFAGYVDAMETIEKSECASRKEADDILQRWEQDIGVRQFLLINLTRSPSDAPFWTFRIPLGIIRKHIPQLGDFPYGQGDRKWDGRALFVKGSKSAYINRKNIPLAADMFPSMRLVTLDAGHWVQAEKPREFVDLVEQFVKGQDVGEQPS